MKVKNFCASKDVIDKEKRQATTPRMKEIIVHPKNIENTCNSTRRNRRPVQTRIIFA
jgi:hypothetical protein